MTRSALCFLIAGMPLSMMGGLAACEADETSGAGPVFELPDGSFTPFDAAPTSFDAGDAGPGDAGTDAASDAADVADASSDADASIDADASDGAVAITYSGLIGTAGGSLNEDRCAAGQVVVGLEGGTVSGGFYDGVLTKVRTLCGTPKLPAAGTTKVTVEAGLPVPPNAANARGTAVALVTQVSCPTNQVVIGVRGNVMSKNFPPPRDLATHVQITCAPLTYANGVVSIGAGAPVTGGIGTANGAAVGPFDCGPGTIAAGMRIHSGDVADGLRARCEPVVILP